MSPAFPTHPSDHQQGCPSDVPTLISEHIRQLLRNMYISKGLFKGVIVQADNMATANTIKLLPLTQTKKTTDHAK